MSRYSPPKWSPIELTYLKENREKMTRDQLCIALAKSKNAISRKLDEFDGKPVPKKVKGRSKIGRREDLDLFVRSGWEANVLRWIKSKRWKWEYEPRTFFYEKYKHGTVSYTPDIWLPGRKMWIEVKGQLKPSDKTRIRRFKKFYPEEFKKLTAIVGSPKTAAAKFFEEVGVPILVYYNELNKECRKKVKNWE